MRILYVTTVGATMGFFKAYINRLKAMGHEVDIACNDREWAAPEYFRELGCRVIQVDFSRSPLNIGNFKAIRHLKSIVENGDYDIVHCHTPVAAMCARLACRKARKKGLRVIYTAHGFHFFKGAPKKNWLIFYPIERFCARFTDVLITINTEDYALAQKKMRAKRVEYVPGVGIDIDKFASVSVDKAAKRAELGIPEDSYAILSVGELNANKNHKTVLEAIAKLDRCNVCYAIAGKGELENELRERAKELNVKLLLLGYRSDVAELYKSFDLFVHPSYREGLPVSVMEAIAAAQAVICSDIRGSRDLVTRDQLFAPNDTDTLTKLIASSMDKKLDRRAENLRDLQKFAIGNVIDKLESIYFEK